MSITFDSDVPRDIVEKDEPCMCAQMAEGWSDFYEGKDTPQLRDQLKQEANPNCPFCKGTGVEKASHEVGNPTINLANENAKALFEILGLPFDNAGEMDIPTARRAIMRAMSRGSYQQFERPEETQYGKPREVSPGVVDLKPLRWHDPGLSEEKIKAYITRFADFVAQVIQLGGSKIRWG
jgi:hypothetical protein